MQQQGINTNVLLQNREDPDIVYNDIAFEFASWTSIKQ